MELAPPFTSIPLYLPANDCGTVIRKVGGDMYISNFIVIQKYRFTETAWDTVENVSCKIPPSEASFIANIRESENRAYRHSDGLMAWIELRLGANAFSGQEINKMTVGDEITLAVHLKDSGQNKDIRVRKCWAFDGDILEESKYVLEFYDFDACEESVLMSNFTLITGTPNVSDILTYATLKAFKFPSTIHLHFTCAIEVCSNECLSKCKDIHEKYNGDVPREFHKRATDPMESENISHRVPHFRRRLERVSYPLSDQAYIDRINYMKATIKAMGSKLIKVSESKSENDSSFRRRVSDSTIFQKSGRILKKPTISNKFLENDNILMNDSSTEIIVKPWNVVYVFNLSRTVVVESAHGITFRNETFNVSQIFKNCVSKLRFILITVSLAFLIFCLALISIALAISLRREKKRHKIDSFLLYNYF